MAHQKNPQRNMGFGTWNRGQPSPIVHALVRYRNLHVCVWNFGGVFHCLGDNFWYTTWVFLLRIGYLRNSRNRVFLGVKSYYLSLREWWIRALMSPYRAGFFRRTSLYSPWWLRVKLWWGACGFCSCFGRLEEIFRGSCDYSWGVYCDSKRLNRCPALVIGPALRMGRVSKT
jgi:hypothetical protein